MDVLHLFFPEKILVDVLMYQLTGFVVTGVLPHA
jgi:hypothetical protein